MCIVLLALSTTCLAQDGGRNLLMNPGFEQDGGWGMRPAELISWDETIARSGEQSLRISDPAGQSNPWAPQSVEDLQGGATYAFSAYYRTPPAGMGEQWSAAVKIEFYNEDGEHTRGVYARSTEATNGEWRTISRTAVAPPDTARASVLVRLFGSGTVWFDDCRFVVAEPAPPVTLAPAHQAPDVGTEQFTVTARFAEDLGDDSPPLDLSVQQSDGTALDSEFSLSRIAPDAVEVTVETPPLQSGSYRIDPMYDEKPGAGAWVHVPLTERKPRNLTDSGTILVDGEPFFPIGLYHVSGSKYQMVAEAGFNCVQGSGTMDLEAFGTSLDAAHEAGLMVDVPLYWEGKVLENLPTSLQKIEQYADHPAVLCWKIIDEPDLREDVMEQVPWAYTRLKEADRRHPIELTIASRRTYEYWANFCDILQIDPYPLPENPLTMVSDKADAARAHLEPWQNLTAVLQAGWRKKPWNQPTPEQALSEVYLALIHGAKGIFWYSLHDPGWHLEETPLWDAFPAINAEVEALSMPVMVGDHDERVSVESEGDLVHWRAWRYEGRTWLLMTNPFEVPVTATVYPGGRCSVRDLHGEGLEDLTDTFKVDLPGYGAQTLLLERE